jgi:hypothetical protein
MLARLDSDGDPPIVTRGRIRTVGCARPIPVAVAAGDSTVDGVVEQLRCEQMQARLHL